MNGQRSITHPVYTILAGILQGMYAHPSPRQNIDWYNASKIAGETRLVEHIQQMLNEQQDVDLSHPLIIQKINQVALSHGAKYYQGGIQ
jgi:hypothetical protein